MVKFGEGIASPYFHKPWKVQTSTKTKKNKPQKKLQPQANRALCIKTKRTLKK